MIGTIVNTAAIVAGALVGLTIRKGIPERFGDTIMQGLGLAVILIGLQMAFQTQNPLIVIGSIVVGAIIGELIDIERWLSRFGTWLEGRFGNGSESGGIARGFVTASLLYCVGAMAIMGALEDGLTGQPNTLFAKSMLDGVASVILTSTLGIGVIFSAVPVFVYQGGITLAASWVAPVLSPWVIAELTATGGLLILAIGINVLGMTRIRVGNLLPAIFVAALAAIVIERFFA
ncbi:MAG: DUF554 domain-containing protein [Eubacteriales bacterium]|nr:DUF554 domain-containing protein [Bacillota bacterium]MBV1728431.1 DUF554 domain-containing protein [Desulforudis sp.]MDP3051224.1 DUF554 domain-containing protein [Eubacteriales bacterium]MDQ7788918.1 DUF554 domain-containing protein [Clostridia bacterium]MBU4555020.1 DUF554 domain-containing protein [Bacillota bacterium]